MSLTPNIAHAFGVAIDALESDATHARHTTDPVSWAKEVLGVHLWSKQRDIARSVVENRQTVVQSAAGIGKSYLASVLALWFGSVHPQYETKIVTTAPSADQVSLILWAEIRKHHERAGLPGNILLNDRWVTPNGKHVIGYGRKPPDYSTSAFQGAHATNMLIIADEAGGLNPAMWANITAIATGSNVHILAIGNPDDNSSEFAKMCQPGSGWNHFKVSTFDTPKFTGEEVPTVVWDAMPDPAFVEKARNSWGEQNPYYQAKVLGEFADADTGLIPLSWITQACQRYRDFFESYDPYRSLSGRTIFGVDVARFGEDKTAIARRQGHVLFGVELHSGKDNVEVANMVGDLLRAYPASVAVVDADGLGAGVVDVLRHRGQNVRAYSGGKGTRRRDSTGTQRFTKVRSAAWYHLRELLNPALGASVCLPEDANLIAELVAMRWPDDNGNLIQLERKDKIRKRLGRSTDSADAVVQAFWTDAPPEHELPSNRPVPQAAAYADAVEFEPPVAGWDGGALAWDF